jgi:hypothetical protein
VSYQYKASPTFWRKFYALSPSQKASTRSAWAIFKRDPFDARLRTHLIHSLSAEYRRNVYAVEIERDLRAAFFIAGSVVVTIDIGSHDIYEV